MLSAHVPEGATFVSATTTQGTVDGPEPGETGLVTAALGIVPADAVITVTIVVTAVAPGGETLTFTATPTLGTPGEVTTFVVADDDPFFTWNPPAVTPEMPIAPPQNARIETPGDERSKVIEGPPPTLIGYKVYRATTPNVQPSPSNIFGTFPPNQTNTGSLSATQGSYFVVTACYSNGAESAPSNEVSSGAGEPVLTSITIQKSKLTAVGSGFVAPVQVTVDGLTFSAAAAVKKNDTKVVQKGKLSNGQNISKYLANRPVALLCFRNNTGATTCIELK
jgi:hypothetical protein